MDIVVLAGGLSPERDVSLSSGCLVANALLAGGHRVLLVDLYEGLAGAQDFGSAYARHSRESYHHTVPRHPPDLAALRARHPGRKEWIGPGVLPLCQSADVVFLALHGAMGENGQLQAVLDAYGVRYTGTGYAGSLLAMDKLVAKQLMARHGVVTPEWAVCTPGQATAPFLPCVVKPAACGSSIGVSVVKTATGFSSALRLAAGQEGLLLAERLVVGREFSVGILGGEALPAIEILPKDGFYGYESKYQQDGAREECPANIGPALARRLQQAALRVHEILRLGAYSRVDFIVDGAGTPFCLEANTLPGMTPTSLLPQEAAAVGISYQALCEKIIALALQPG